MSLGIGAGTVDRPAVLEELADDQTWSARLRSAAQSNIGFARGQIDRRLARQKVEHRTGADEQGINDPNDVTVKQDFASTEAAQKMLTSKEIQAALAEAGVVGPPSVWMVEQVG